MVEPQALQEALDCSTKGGVPFPEALVNANLVADWELSRVVCELYSLPCLTVEMCQPDMDAFEDIDREYVRETGLIPLGRYGQVLTVCMPGLVPAEVLGLLAAQLDLFILPVVGTVRTNRMWLDANMSAPVPASALEESVDRATAEWSDIFDAADAAVLLDLEPGEEPGDDEATELFELEDSNDGADAAESNLVDMPKLGPATNADDAEA